MARHAVITGLGIVSPIGIGIDAFWRAACEGRSGIGRPTLFDASKLAPECQIVGEVKDFNPRDWMPGTAAKTAGRFSQFAVAAAKMAMTDARLHTANIPPERLQVSIGTALHGEVDVDQPTAEAFSQGGAIKPWVCLEYPAHAATSHVGIAAGARGQTATIATACAAGLDAIAWAAEVVKSGRATAVIAGGTDTPLSPYTLSTFHAVGVLSKWQGPAEEASRPFDALRTGLVLAEGAAVVIVEDEEHARSRNASVYARLCGAASVSEGAHLRKVDETGTAAAAAMAGALTAAAMAPQDIDLIVAHGNSMRDYDTAETTAIKSTFRRHAWSIPVTSIKSMCGQALAASGPTQIVLSCLSLRHNVVSPTVNYTHPDAACDLDYVPNRARRARVRSALVHAHGLGGSHTAIVLAT
jgi:3-oxoacyl-[acyl-carrier-protein] synthase II